MSRDGLQTPALYRSLRVVVPPTVRSEIGDAARLSGDYTRAEAGRIVRGVTLR